MLGLFKNAVKGKEEKKRYVISSFGEETGAGVLTPASYKNCDCRGGILRGGIGLKKCLDENGEHLEMGMNVNSSVPRAFFVTINSDGVQVNTKAVYLVGVDGCLYMRLDNGNPWKRVHVGTNVEHSAMKSEDRIIYNFFCGDTSVYGTTNGSTMTSIVSVDNAGACVCKKRYFILTRNGELLYTSALNPYEEYSDDPDGAGAIYLPVKYGAPVGVKEFKGKVYIFFEKGICKLTVASAVAESVLEEVGYHGGTICLRAQAVTSKGILFLASEGAYYLRNDRVERVCEHLPIGPCATDSNCGVGYCDELVIFSYQKEGGAQKRLVLYDDGKSGYFTEEYGSLSGNEYTYLNGKFYLFAKDNEEIIRKQQPSFSSKEIALESPKNKRLKRLLLKGEGSVTVGVQSGERERKYSLVFHNGVARTRLLDRGKEFILHFYLDAGSFVSGAEIEYVTGE